MPTVIDSFVVELGLDSSKFTKGQQAAYDAARKLEEQSVKGAKNIEHGAESAGDAISGLRTQALGMLAVFTGGKGLIDFSLNLTHANASLGRLERNLGVSASTISKWQGVARIFGGDAAAMAQSFTTISDAFAGWQIGKVSPLIADLRAISTAGGKVIDVNKGVEQSMLDLAENLKRIHDSGPEGPARAGLLGRQVGLEPALFDAMISGNLQKVLDYVQKIGAATKADTDAFGELEKRIGQMGLKGESLGRKAFGGDGTGGSLAGFIMESADVLNMTPGEAWAYLNRTDRQATRNRRGGAGTGLPGQDILSGGAFTSQLEKEQFIRSEAAKRGINPNVAMQVAKSEGFNGFVSSIPGEQSYGAFQLHITPGGRGRAVGDQFRAKTGLDPADRANERATISFALDDAKRNGWTAYHGAANTGIPQWAGIDRGGAGSTTTTEVNINGPITVAAPAGSDPADFADRFAAAIKRQSFASQANGGQN